MSAAAGPPKVSVVVPVYNSESTVERTIDSLLALDYPAGFVELIFVDNASTDRTRQILAAREGAIRVFHENKRGRSSARNRGIREARHHVVALTDADCTVDPGWLSALVAPLDDPSIGISGGRILAQRPCNAIQDFGEWLHDHERAINVYRPPYAVTANWASRRSVLLEVGCFDEDFRRSEDVDLAFRILQAGYRITFQPGAIVYHQNQPDLRGLFREGFAHGFHSVKTLKKHRAFLRQYGHRWPSMRSYVSLGTNLVKVAGRRASPEMLYDTVFNLGKKAGKVLGSLRFGYPGL